MPICTLCDQWLHSRDVSFNGKRVCVECIKALSELVGIKTPKETEEEVLEELLADIDWRVNSYVEDAVNDALRKLKHAREKAQRTAA